MESSKDKTLKRSASRPDFSEMIIVNNRKRKQEILEKLKNEKDQGPMPVNKIISLDDVNEEDKIAWEYDLFKTEILPEEEIPIINSTWKPTDIKASAKGIDINKLIFRSQQNYQIMNKSIIEINTSLSLKGESSFWLFTRVLTLPDENSAIIKIKKEDNSQKLFILFGAFVKDLNNKLVFRIFHKQQLIDFGERPTGYIKNDYSDIRLMIIDHHEKMDVNVFVNTSKTPNILKADFYLPYIGYSKVIFAGIDKCNIKSLICKVTYNTDENLNDKRCNDCCIVI